MKTKKPKSKAKPKIKVRKLVVTKVHPEVHAFIAAPPPGVPEPVIALVKAIQPGVEITWPFVPAVLDEPVVEGVKVPPADVPLEGWEGRPAEVPDPPNAQESLWESFKRWFTD